MKNSILYIFLTIFSSCLFGQDTSSEEENLKYSISKIEFSRLNIIKLLVDGVFDNEDGYQKWRAPKQTLIPLDAEGYAYSVVDTILSLEIEDKKCQLVITKSSQKYSWGGFDSGVESLPCIGLALFSENNDQWVLESFNPAVTLFGEQNMIPEMHICKVGPDKHVIAFTQNINQDVGEEQWFLIEKNFPSFLEYYYAYPGGEELEKLIYTKVEPIEVNDETTGEFFNLKVTQFEETYDEKTDKSKQKILETKILSPSFDDFKLKYPYNEK